MSWFLVERQRGEKTENRPGSLLYCGAVQVTHVSAREHRYKPKI